MQFGIFDWIDRSGLEAADSYDQRLKLLEYADRAGFFAYHLAEHHGTPLSLAPAPSVFLAAAAQHTRRIRLGTLAYLLPLYSPVRLVEEICMLDHLSRGRLEVGVSRGASPFELALYNVDAEQSRAIFLESLTVVTTGLAQGVVTFEGQYVSCKDVRFDLRPFQRPYPPLWYPTNYADSFPWIAQEGLSTIVGTMAPVETRAQFDLCRRVSRASASASGRLNGHVREPKYGIMRHVYVAESDAEALRDAKAAFTAWTQNLTYMSALHGSTSRLLGRDADFETNLKKGVCIAGAPATVRRTIEDQVRETGCNYFVGAFATGTLTTEQILRSLTLFAEQVMPAFPAR
jgi:alkanesulfonate monooxygenase SsuD/methylene tetrahydromethanopterin reductase-like flavin-dependent oxidoreductase (luciferase family)